MNRRSIAVVVVMALGVAACGGSGTGGGDTAGGDTVGDPVVAPATAAPSSDPTTDDPTTDDPASLPATEVDPDQLTQLATSLVEELAGADVATLEDRARAAAVELELELAEVSGLAESLGGRDAARLALSDAWAPIIEQARAVEDDLAGVRFEGASATAGPSVEMGLFAGYLAATLGIEGALSQVQSFPPGSQPQSEEIAPGVTVTVGPDSAQLEVVQEVTINGVRTTLKLTTKAVACPGPDGRLRVDTAMDVRAEHNGRGQTARLEVAVEFQLDDDANVETNEIETRLQLADHGGSARGQFVDTTLRIPFDGGPSTVRVNRTGGAVTKQLVETAVSTQTIFGLLGLGPKKAVERHIDSGVCVTLTATANPGTTLPPRGNATISVTSISRKDGAPTGGSYRGIITAGRGQLDPSDTKVPADATLSFTAPDTAGESSTVSLEARSRRGVGRTTITFNTAAGWAIDEVVAGVRFTGVSCGSHLGPWTISYKERMPGGEVSGSLSGQLGADGTGSMEFRQSITVPGQGSVQIGSSAWPARIAPTSEGYDLTIDGGDFGGFASIPGVPRTDVQGSSSGAGVFRVRPATAEQCPSS